MPKDTPTTPPKPPAPVFDAKTANAVKPTRHEATARTVAFQQPAADAPGKFHLFSATRVFIATGEGFPAAETKNANQ